MSDTTTIDEQPIPASMILYLSGFQVSQAVYVVAKLGVVTILEQEGSQPVGKLAERTGAQPEALSRLIRTLAPLGLFTTGPGDLVTVTEMGAVLSEKHPLSMHEVACMWMETHYLPFSELLHTVRTGTPGAEKYFGEPFMSWMAAEPERAAQFSRAMAGVTVSFRNMFDNYQLPEGRTIADIGGADGSVLIELLKRDADTTRRGIVFDQPNVVPNAERTLAAVGLADRVDVVAGDFFTAVPAADIYLLSYILHDWDDASSRRILAAIAQAAKPGARLLVVEGIVPDGDEPHLTKAIDLTMLGMVSGKERSEQEYRDLLDSAGYTLDRIIPTPSPYAILEATLR
ncbi:methyltransferase [Nocardia altamirensis]|uniref:methyltransferase n=1 Tax=Nocardia altamirensis TaxID=472158 RepID=UPI0009FE53E5|nr:methyltransferase [Nocardia altamirensis]